MTRIRLLLARVSPLFKIMTTPSASRPTSPVGTVVTASAMQVAALQPQIALATDDLGHTLRTTNGGRTWTLMSLPAELTAPPNPYGAFSHDPLIMAVDGMHIYINERYESSPDASNQGIASSADGGVHWSLDNPQDQPIGGAGGDQLVSLSPLSAGVIYTYDQYQGGSTLVRSGPGAQDPNTTDPSTLAPASANAVLGMLLPDTALPHVLYSEVRNANDDSPLFVARSTDDGAHWRRVPLPPGLTPATAPISVDPHLPGRLILRPDHPANRLYSSADGGATWQYSYCPGVLRGACPSRRATSRPSRRPRGLAVRSLSWVPPTRWDPRSSTAVGTVADTGLALLRAPYRLRRLPTAPPTPCMCRELTTAWPLRLSPSTGSSAWT